MGNEWSIIWLRVIAFDRVQSQYLGTTRCDWFEVNWCKSGCNFMQPSSLALLHALFQVTRSCTCVLWAITVCPHMSRCLIEWTSITSESPRRCTAICELLSENKPIIIDCLIRLEKSTQQNPRSTWTETWCHLIISVDKTAVYYISSLWQLHTVSYCLLQGPCACRTVIQPPRFPDIDDQQCSSVKVCWLSKKSDLLPITGFRHFCWCSFLF